MPPIRHLVETALYCEDLDRTARFYRQLLDRAPMLATERLVAFDAGRQTVLLLFQRELAAHALAAAGGVIPGHTGSGPVHLAFAIDREDWDAWAADLEGRGIAIESRVSWDRGGRSLYFRDPDGRSVELVTPGIWPSY